MSAPSPRQTTLRVLRALDQGPLSTVHVALRPHGRGYQPVALKVYATRFQRDVRLLTSVRDQGRQLELMGHRNLTPIQDIAQVGDRLALVSPLVDGIDLQHWVDALYAQQESLPGRVCCEIVRGVATGLDAALNRELHQGAGPLGAVHGDVKPSNILIRRDGETVLVDFGAGFSSIAGRDARAGALQHGLGKYLSPARRSGKRGGATADVYALGIVAVELFSRRWLRRLRTANPAHDRQLSEVIAGIDDTGMRTSADEDTLRSVLLRMVAHDPDARPTAGEVAHTFRLLGERGRGAGLERFVLDELAHRLELPPSPEAPASELEATLVDGHALKALEVDPAQLPRSPVQGRQADRTVWEETEEGWQEAVDWEFPEELSQADTDDEVPDPLNLPEAPPQDPGAWDFGEDDEATVLLSDMQSLGDMEATGAREPLTPAELTEPPPVVPLPPPPTPPQQAQSTSAVPTTLVLLGVGAVVVLALVMMSAVALWWVA